MFKDINDSIVYCLKAAMDAGELSPSTDVREVASFLYSSWQGAILQSKVEQSIKPLERFKRVLFTQVLH
jgi:TetR/AcrR family transcriptional repressor of nem operon